MRLHTLITPATLTFLCLGLLCLALTGCGTADPTRYKNLDTSAQLVPNPKDDGGRVPYRYAAAVNWHAYDKIIIDPVTIYSGDDQQFGDMDPKDKAELAHYMQRQFNKALSQQRQLMQSPSDGTLRVKLTLTGAETNTPVVTTLTHFDIAGGLYNGVQAIRGHEGAMGGAVMYSVEIYDAQTSRLLNAYISKRYPRAMDIGSTIGSLAGAKTGIEKGAEALAEELR
ncbi:MAG: DUF3313 domain-containing protein [Rhizomicrobium sp.]